MENFELLIGLVIVIGGLIASAAKNQKKDYKSAPPGGYAPKKTVSTAPPPAPPKAAPAYQPAQPLVAAPAEGMSTMAPTAQPQVHAHLEPDCETHDVPGTTGAVSMEGKDPCHEEQLSRLRRREQPRREESEAGLNLDWSSDSLVKAFVMQEVLTRPCDRRRR